MNFHHKKVTNHLYIPTHILFLMIQIQIPKLRKNNVKKIRNRNKLKSMIKISMTD
jgi:hypothetical protein